MCPTLGFPRFCSLCAVLRGARGEFQHPPRSQRLWRHFFRYQCAAPWSRGDSNPGPPPCKGGALPAELRPRPRSVGAPGLEPGTSALSGPRSHHLSYAPGAVDTHRLALCRRRSRPPKSRTKRQRLSRALVASLPGPAWILSMWSPRNRCPPAHAHQARCSTIGIIP